MRVTNNIQERQYLRNTNKSLESMLKSLERTLTQKAYKRASEDSINATKAMATRRQLSNIAMYKDNLGTAKEIYNMAETNLMGINDKYVQVVGIKLNQGCNTTLETEQRQAIALELRETADFMMSLMNADFAERQVFGGTSNGGTPFTYEACRLESGDGTVLYDSGDKKVVCYNGIPLDADSTKAPYNTLANGDYSVFVYNDDGTETETEYTLNFEDARDKGDNSLLFPGSKPIFVDVGMGIKYNDNYEVDPQTAMDISLNGAKLTGSGVDELGQSKNMIQLVYDAAEALANGDLSTANGLIDRINNANGYVLSAVTSLGSKENSVDFYLEKNSEYETSLLERQNDVEGVDIEAEISNMESLEAAYNAALQLSSRVLPLSLFDFV